MSKRLDRKKRRALDRLERKMNRKIEKRVREDLPTCSWPECESQSTHLLMEKDSLKVYAKTKDRKDIRLWGACDMHHRLMARALQSQGVDIQVATGRAILHLGEVEAVQSDSSDQDETSTPLTPESG